MEILHITGKVDWQAALNAGDYTAPSLVSEGFIHCSTARQVARTANKYYAGQSGLVLLHIDTEQLVADLRWEASDGDEFPHIYGPINLDAVRFVEEFSPAEDGLFRYG